MTQKNLKNDGNYDWLLKRDGRTDTVVKQVSQSKGKQIQWQTKVQQIPNVQEEEKKEHDIPQKKQSDVFIPNKQIPKKISTANMVIPENRVSTKDLAMFKNIPEEKPKVSVTSLYDNPPK